MIIRPLADRILAKKVIQEEIKKGGLILPDSSKNKQEIYEVVAVGPGKMTEEGSWTSQSVPVGSNILIEKYSGQEVTLDDQDYFIIKSDNVIAIVG